MSKQYLDIDVYQAAQKRLKYLFKEFDHLLISFSGGKDSGVMFNLVYDYAKKHKQLDKIAIYFMDYEAQYQKTIEYVKRTFKKMPAAKKYWLCLPISARSAVSINTKSWIPWDPDKKDKWVRPMPQDKFVINQTNVPFKFKKGTQGHTTRPQFNQWFADNHLGKTAVLVGIRADESLNRYRAIKSDHKVNQYDNKNWLLQQKSNLVNAYPIYDWQSRDDWIANYKFNWDYNKIYDDFYKVGVSIDDMRVASPFIDEAISSLSLYKKLDPTMWSKLVQRVDGANFASIYGKTKVMGRSGTITLPNQFNSWKEYFISLSRDLPVSAKKMFEGHTEYREMCQTILKNEHTNHRFNTQAMKNKEEKRRKAIEKYSKLL